jgi:hypothetical protein
MASGATSVGRAGTARMAPAALNAFASLSVPAGGFAGAFGLGLSFVRRAVGAAMIFSSTSPDGLRGDGKRECDDTRVEP